MLDTLMSVLVGIKDAVLGAIKSILANPESVVILTLAAVGTTAVLSELPYMVMVPLWLEAAIVTPMILPVISVGLIAGLVYIMKFRLGLEGAC